MEVNLEPIEAPENAELASTDADDPPPPAALARAQSVLAPAGEARAESDVPVKRPRGRPKGKAAPKVPAPKKAPVRVVSPRRKVSSRRPPSSSSDSSSDEEPRRPRGASAAVRHLMDGDDMETQVLQFLHARKQSQAQKRNTLWQQLASSGLRR